MALRPQIAVMYGALPFQDERSLSRLEDAVAYIFSRGGTLPITMNVQHGLHARIRSPDGKTYTDPIVIHPHWYGPRLPKVGDIAHAIVSARALASPENHYVCLVHRNGQEVVKLSP